MEALYAFAAWLTTREEVVTLSRRHDAGVPCDLVAQFCEANRLAQPRDGWQNLVTWPGKSSVPSDAAGEATVDDD